MGKMFITRDSYGKAMANLALDVLKANVEQELFNEINMLEAIEVIENYVANSKLVNVKEVKVSGKVIAERMRGNITLKPFAKRFACLENVTRDDLENGLPDYISGGVITNLFNNAQDQSIIEEVK
tara:strand:+ start:1204 stop:1578 length:375 start_codon:yes stop_codon:yes gene_type:complete